MGQTITDQIGIRTRGPLMSSQVLCQLSYLTLAVETILAVLNDRSLPSKNILGLFFQGLVSAPMNGMIDINEWDVRYTDRSD